MATPRRIARAAETRDVELIRAQLRAVTPCSARGLRLGRDVLEQRADFDARAGILEHGPDAGRALDVTVVRFQ